MYIFFCTTVKKKLEILTVFYFYPQKVHSLEEDGKPAPVCCLEVERGLENKYFIIATTRKRLFQFVGKVSEGSEQQGFSSIFSQNQDLLPSFQEFPANMGYSEITFYTSKLRTSPKAFGWMMGNGVLYGQLDYVRPDSLLSEVQVSVCLCDCFYLNGLCSNQSISHCIPFRCGSTPLTLTLVSASPSPLY